MAEPQSAGHHALHDENPNGGAHVQAWRARTRDSVARDDHDPLSLTERNRERIAKRWGQPIEEPTSGPSPADVDEDTWRAILRGLTVHLHLIRDPLPSMRAVRADYLTGLEDAQQQSATAAVLYRLFGLPGQALSLLFRFLAVTCDRPGRFAGFLFITALLAAALAWAGLI